MTKLVCTDCKHENEPERIYCHNCGARLDRSGIKEKRAPEDNSESTRQHLRKMFAPDRGRNKRVALKLAKTFCGALGCAVVIQMLLPPDLPALKKSDAFAPMINMDLFTALEKHNPPRLTYSQDQVNSYLNSSIHRSSSPAGSGYFPINRIFVQFDEGLCRINVRHTFIGLPVSDGSTYRVSIEGGKIATSTTSGYVGRMPIHPFIMDQLSDLLFQHAWESLARERKDVARLAGIEFHPQAVTLITARQP